MVKVMAQKKKRTKNSAPYLFVYQTKKGWNSSASKMDENEAILSHSKSNLWALKTEDEHPTHGIFNDELDLVTFPWWLPTRCG